MASHPHQQESIWESIWGSFKASNYITDCWNWLMTLMSKSAEPVLFGSVLYSGYELLPNVPHPPALADALVFIIQSAALDIGGMGLLKLAKRAGLPRSSFPVRVGVTLVALMIANVALASIKQAYPQAPSGTYLFIETGLLIARAVMAVLFGHAIYALREEVGDVSFTVKDVRALKAQIEQVTVLLSASEQQFHAALEHHHRESLKLLAVFQQQQHERIAESERLFQQQISAAIQGLSLLPIMTEQIRHLEEMTQVKLNLLAGELSRVKAHIERQEMTQPAPSSAEKRTGSPAKMKAPIPILSAFDRKRFVFTCLQEDAEMKIAEIQRRAAEKGQTIATGTISKYRTEFQRSSNEIGDEMQTEQLPAFTR